MDCACEPGVLWGWAAEAMGPARTRTHGSRDQWGGHNAAADPEQSRIHSDPALSVIH